MTLLSRRDCLKWSACAGAATLLPAGFARAREPGELIRRMIPGTDEALPIVGLGSSATFRRVAESGDIEALRDVLSTLFDNGGSVFDTAPSYGDSEAVAGRIVQDMNATDRVFWATKLNVVPRGGSRADPAEARAQLERSFSRIGKDPIDLVQVHNLRDVPTQLGLLKEHKEAGRIRYIGVTYTGEEGYPELASVMQSEPIDFIGVDYAVDNREAARTIFPIAQDRGIGVLVYLPFGRTRLWNRVGDRPVPDWAGELGVETWAQFFIKYAAAHPAVTVVTPATSKPQHMLDNLRAGVGALPDAGMQQRMADFVDALPSA
jgi:aryl-alcohol dehydrogenase-like predicted oxidoreductase